MNKIDETMFDNYDLDEDIILKNVTLIPHVVKDGDELFDGSSYNMFYFFKIETEEHADYLETWVRECGVYENFSAKNYVGKYVVVDSDYTDAYSIYDVCGIEEYIAKYVKKILDCLPK